MRNRAGCLACAESRGSIFFFYFIAPAAECTASGWLARVSLLTAQAVDCADVFLTILRSRFGGMGREDLRCEWA